MRCKENLQKGRFQFNTVGTVQEKRPLRAFFHFYIRIKMTVLLGANSGLSTDGCHGQNYTSKEIHLGHVLCFCFNLQADNSIYTRYVKHYLRSYDLPTKKHPIGAFVLLTTEITWFVLVPWALSTALRAAFSRYPPGALQSPSLPTTSPFLRSF